MSAHLVRKCQDGTQMIEVTMLVAVDPVQHGFDQPWYRLAEKIMDVVDGAPGLEVDEQSRAAVLP